MGNSTKSFNQNFLNDWMQIERIRTLQNQKIIWAKKDNKSLQMEQYNLNVSSKEQLQDERKIHAMRQNHPQLVSSLHFQDETVEEFCSSNYKGKIFIERIPLTLQSITDVPFPDALHIYSQALQGFHALANQVENGCFPVSQELIGVNCESVCKVWMNGMFNRNYTSRNQKVTEERMVKNILDVVEENCDLGSLEGKPSPIQYIYQRARTPSQVKFGEAINLLRDYANEFFGGVIPSKISCVEKVGGAFLLSKNWEGQKAQITAQAPQQSQLLNKNVETHVMNSYPQSSSIAVPSNYQSQNLTEIRKQEQVQKPIMIEQQSSQFGQGSVHIVNQQVTPTIVNPPIVQQNPVLQSSQPTQMKISQPPTQVVLAPSFVVPQRVQSPSGVQQILYRNQVLNVNPQTTSMRQSQFVPQPVEIRRSQFIPPQNQFVPQSSTILQNKPITTSIMFYKPPQQQIRQHLIQNTGEQMASQKGIIPQPLIYSRPQPVIGQYPVVFQQQIPLPIQTSQGQVVEKQQNLTNIKQSTIIYNAPGQEYQTQTIQTVVKTTQVVTQVEQQVKNSGRKLINNSELEKVNSKLVIIDRSSSKKGTQKKEDKNKEEFSQYNDYSSNYYAFTSKLYDRQETLPKDEFTTKLPFKQESQPKEQYTNKFYGKQESKSSPFETEFKTSKLRIEDYSRVNYDFKLGKQESTKEKYKVNLDDGMSSPDFLSQLKGLGSSYKASDVKYDFSSSYTLFLNKDYGLGLGLGLDKVRLDGDKTSSQLYKGLQKQQTSFKTDYNTLIVDIKPKEDFTVVEKKSAPISQNEKITDSAQNEGSYGMSYQYEERPTPSGEWQYQEEGVLYMDNNQANNLGVEQSLPQEQQQQQQASQNQYQDYNEEQQQQQQQQTNYNLNFEATAESGNFQLTQQAKNFKAKFQPYNSYQQPNNYRSLFDRYASISKESQIIDDQQFVAQPQESAEQYKVEFDPEILADLQKLKGVN